MKWIKEYRSECGRWCIRHWARSQWLVYRDDELWGNLEYDQYLGRMEVVGFGTKQEAIDEIENAVERYGE